MKRAILNNNAFLSGVRVMRATMQSIWGWCRAHLVTPGKDLWRRIRWQMILDYAALVPISIAIMMIVAGAVILLVALVFVFGGIALHERIVGFVNWMADR